MAKEWKHKIGHTQISLRAAHGGPLLVVREEGAVKAGGDVVREQQFAGKFRRYRGGTVWAGNFLQDAACYTLGQSLVHDPKRQPNVVPSEIAQAAERFERAVH